MASLPSLASRLLKFALLALIFYGLLTLVMLIGVTASPSAPPPTNQSRALPEKIVDGVQPAMRAPRMAVAASQAPTKQRHGEQYRDEHPSSDVNFSAWTAFGHPISTSLLIPW